MNDLTLNSVALITGGSAGLGRTLAGFLATQGYQLILTGRDPARLDRAVREIQDLGGTVQAVVGDISDPDHRQALIDAVRGHGRLDLLVNNASTLGPLPMPRLLDIGPEDLHQVLDVNVVAPLALIQALHPWLVRAGGLVVNVTSDAAVGAYPGWGTYGTSKAALELVSRTLAAELADEGPSVVTVDPGDMRTQMHQDAFPGEDISDRPLPETTLPFWAWLLGRDRAALNGQRFQAQADGWMVGE